MATHTLAHEHEHSPHASLGRWFVVGALAGALAVIVFHQSAAALLFSLGMTERAPYAMQATQPFGVPQLWSITFWGGVWGLALAAALRRFHGMQLVLLATLFGAVFPSLVAWTVVAALKGAPLFAGAAAKGIAVGLIVNAAWGLGTGVGLALFGRR